MKRAALLTALAALSMFLPSAIQAEGETTMTGKYIWENGGTSGELKAVFTPAETAGEWNVVFDFKHRGQSHTYEGTAEGSLSQGELRGNVYNENKRRTFTFKGDFDDGHFQGTHEETTRSRARRTGTLALSVES